MPSKKFATFTVWNTPRDQWMTIETKELTEADRIRIRRELAKKIAARKRQPKKKRQSIENVLWRHLD